MTPTQSLVLSCAALATLTLIVAMRMLYVRISEMRQKRIGPQQVATSVQMAAQLQSVQAADNYKNLFELPVLFYTLCALLIATGKASEAFAAGAWLFVATRCVHSFIHCGYNRVLHRLAAFASGYLVLTVLWLCFIVELLGG